MGLGWVLLYAIVAIGPLVVALTADPPPGRGFLEELSVALGFVGLAMMGLQFAAVSRFARVSAPFGLDVVLHFHRQIAFVALAFVLAHPAIMAAERSVDLINPVAAHWTARAGQLSVIAVVALVATSVWRRRLGLSYEAWRVLHGILAVVAVAAALVHVERVGHYVSGPWKQGLWALFSAVFVALLVNTRVVQPVRQLRRPWRVTSVQPERGDAWTLTLEPEGHGGLRFLPGQFAWLRVHRSPFAVREHPFSFSSSAERPERISFTIKAAGDFTSRVGAIPPGTRAYVDGPYGVFSYDRSQGDGFVFVAGGVGITPIMSMLRTLADRGDRRPCLLLYGNADWDGVIFRAELEDLRDRLDLRVVHVPESPPEGWDGEHGLMDGALLDRHLPERPERQRYFLCGPPPMMAAVRDLLAARGVAPADIEFERFDLI